MNGKPTGLIRINELKYIVKFQGDELNDDELNDFLGLVTSLAKEGDETVEISSLAKLLTNKYLNV